MTEQERSTDVQRVRVAPAGLGLDRAAERLAVVADLVERAGQGVVGIDPRFVGSAHGRAVRLRCSSQTK